MRYEILGPLRVTDDREELDLGSRKQRTLLALLLVNANRVVATERIIDELWPGDPEGHENALWVYISRLRGILEPGRSGRGDHEVLQTRDHGYVLNVTADSVDAGRFERLVTDAGRIGPDDAESASEMLREAEAEWRGRPLEGIDAEFALVEAARLDEVRIAALEERFDLDLRRGVTGNLAVEIEAALQEHPYREKLVGQLMLALYRGGRQADALRTFERFRRTIGEDLGIDPSPELVRLEEQILLHDSRLQLRRPRAAASGPAPMGMPVDAENPFKGLRPFGEDDADDFFGRDRLVSDVIRRVAEGASLVALVGPSGSGKSSALRAGVFPALRKGAVDGSDRWLYAQMVPGARPFAELEAALLRSTLDAPDSLSDQLRGEDGLLGAALRLLPDDTTRLVLMIDQFEELFTLVDDDSMRAAFLDALIPALDDPHRRVILLSSLRADFYGRPLTHPAFGQRMGDGVVNVVPLTTDELESAAVEPMRNAGCHFEPSLLVALLGDVAGEPGALPVFQYTLTELYDRRAGDTLTTTAYEQLGGVHGALAQRAEELYAALSDAEKDVAAQLFLRLVTIGGGDEWGRRRVAAREVLGLDVDVIALQNVIQRFGDRRLLSFDRDPVHGSPTLEVAHEALLTEWPRLHDWIADARVDVQRRASLGTAAIEWDASGRNPDYLFAGTRLAEYERWSGESSLALTTLEREFLGEAVAKRESDVQADAERTAREEALDRRARVRAWGLAAAVVLIAAVGAWLIFFTGGSDDHPTVAGIRASGQLTEQPLHRQLANGLDQAVAELDLEFALIEPVSDALSEIEALLATEPDLVFLEALGGDLEFQIGASDMSLADVILANPDQQFAVPDELFPPVAGAPNVAWVQYVPAEGSFLAGAAAALTSQTGSIGYIGSYPAVTDSFRAGFEAGARHVDPDIIIYATHLTGRLGEVFTIGGDADLVTLDLLERGVDVIYAVTGGAQAVTLETVAAWNDHHAWVIGVDSDLSLLADEAERGHVLTSMLKRHDFGALELLRRFEAGTLEPGPIEGGLEAGIVGLARPGNLDDAAQDEIDELRDQIVEGEIAVPHLPVGPPIQSVGTDYSVDLVIGVSGCSIDPFTPMNNDVVRLDIANDHVEEMYVAVWKVIDGTPVSAVTFESLNSGEISFDFQAVTAVIVPAGASGAVTVDFEDPGDWMIVCITPDDETVASPVFVTEHDATTMVEADAAELCSSELPEVRAGEVLGFDLTNDSDSPKVIDVYLKKDDETELEIDWVLASAARHYRTIFVPPGGGAFGAVLLDEPGTWALECNEIGAGGFVNFDNLAFLVTS